MVLAGSWGRQHGNRASLAASVVPVWDALHAKGSIAMVFVSLGKILMMGQG